MLYHTDRSRADNTVSPTNRNATDYADTVAHCLRNRLVVPRPRNAAERKILAATFGDICREMAVQG